MPLANSGQLTHWLAFASTLPHRFDAVHLEHVLLHVNLAASLIIRPIALRSLTRESNRQRHQIEGLADIQKSLLPDNPKIRGLDYAIYWQPAETAAGDYYEMSNLTGVRAAGFPANRRRYVGRDRRRRVRPWCRCRDGSGAIRRDHAYLQGRRRPTAGSRNELCQPLFLLTSQPRPLHDRVRHAVSARHAQSSAI